MYIICLKDRNGTWLSDDLCSASFGVVCSYDVGSRNWIANKEMDAHKGWKINQYYFPFGSVFCIN